MKINSYHANVIFLQFFGIFFSVLTFYLIAKMIGDAAVLYLEPYGGDYFSFVLIFLLLGVFLFGVNMSDANLFAAMIILILTIICFSGLGIISASFIMV